MPPKNPRKRRGLTTEQHLDILHGKTPDRGFSIFDALDAILERREVQRRGPAPAPQNLPMPRAPMGAAQATHQFPAPAAPENPFRMPNMGTPAPSIALNKTRSQAPVPQTLPQRILADQKANREREVRAILADASIEIGHRIVNPVYDIEKTVLEDIPRDRREGNTGSQALNIAGMFPYFGITAKAAKKAKRAQQAARDAEEVAEVVGSIEPTVEDIVERLSDAIYNPQEFIPPGWTPERVAKWQMGAISAANPHVTRLMERLQAAGITPSPGAIAAFKHDHRIREFEKFGQPETYGKVIEELKGNASRNPFETVMLPQGKGLTELSDLELQVLEGKIKSAQKRFDAMKGKPDAAGNMRAADYDMEVLQWERERRAAEEARSRPGTLRTGDLPKGAREPVEFVRQHAKSYMDQAGIPDTPIERVTENDADFHGRIAKAYEAAENQPNDPKVRAAYKAFVDETERQFKHIQDQGITIEPVQSDPYKSSAEMMADVRDNKRLKVFAGSLEHPLLTPEENLHFRAVHDYFAHAGEGNQFGAIGEENAFRAHARMYSPEARKALATETRGQNSWVNFSEANKGKAPKDRAFATQKATILDDEFSGATYPVDPGNGGWILPDGRIVDMRSGATRKTHDAVARELGFDGVDDLVSKGGIRYGTAKHETFFHVAGSPSQKQRASLQRVMEYVQDNADPHNAPVVAVERMDPKSREMTSFKQVDLYDVDNGMALFGPPGEPFTSNEIGKALSITGKTDSELILHRNQLRDQIAKVPAAQRNHPTVQDLISDKEILDEEIRMRGGLKGVKEEIEPNTLPHEDELLAGNRLEARRARQAEKKLPSVEQLAAAGLAGLKRRGWYTNSVQALSDVFGPDAPRFAALLAATSPRTTVQENLKIALRAWSAWVTAGRPSEIEGARNALTRLVDMKGRVPNSVTALTTPNVADIKLSGPKVDSFYQNLIGDTQRVTLDTWMAQLANMDQANLSAGGGPSGKYVAYSKRVRETAKHLSEVTGHPWTPADVQSATWSWMKAVGEDQNIGQMGLFGGSELVNPAGLERVPDFDRLLNAPQYKGFLDELGLPAPSKLPPPAPLNAPAPNEEHLQALYNNFLRSKQGKYILGTAGLGFGLGAAQQNAAPPERRGLLP